jgi:hypothetical protein
VISLIVAYFFSLRAKRLLLNKAALHRNSSKLARKNHAGTARSARTTDPPQGLKKSFYRLDFCYGY